MERVGKLIYNLDNDRFGIIDTMDIWEIEGLHCGDGLEIYVQNNWTKDTLEMTREGVWYLVKNKISGMDLEGLKVRY